MHIHAVPWERREGRSEGVGEKGKEGPHKCSGPGRKGGVVGGGEGWEGQGTATAYCETACAGG